MAVVFNGTGDATVILDYDNYRVGNCSARSIGNNAYLNIKIPGEDIKLANDFTIEGWFYFDSAWATYEMIAFKKFIEINGDPTTIVESYDGINNSSDDPDFYVGYSNDQGSLFTPNPTLTVGFKEIDSEQHHQLFYQWELPTEQWIHIAVVRNNNLIRLYINGQETTSAEYSGNQLLNYIPVDEGIEYSPSSLYDQYPNAAPYAFDTNVKIGLDYHGNFDEFRIRNGAVYTSNFTPSTTPFEPSLISDILLLHFDGNFSDDIYNVRGDSEISAQFTATTLAGVIQPITIAVDSAFSQSTQGSLVIPASTSITASAAVTTNAGLVLPGNLELTSAIVVDVDSQVNVAAELAVSGVLTADASIVGLLDSDIPATAAFTANITGTNLVIGELAVDAATAITADEQLTLGTTVALDAEFAQTTTAGNIIRLVYPFNWLTHPTWDEWLIWQNTFTLPATFTQTTQGDTVELHLAEMAVSAEFVTDTDSTVAHTGIIDVESNFESYVSFNGVIPADTAINAVFDISTTTQVQRPAELDLTSASEFSAAISGSRPGDIDVSATTTIAVDSTVEHTGVVQATAEFVMVSSLGRVSDAEIDTQATFTATIDSLVNYGSAIQLNTAFNNTVDAGIIHDAALAVSAETAQSLTAQLTLSTDMAATAEFAVDDITPLLIVNGAAEWTALTATAIVAFVERPDPCRTLTVLAETRTLTVGAETRTLNIRTCSLRRAA